MADKFGVVILAVEMPLVVPDQLAETARKKTMRERAAK